MWEDVWTGSVVTVFEPVAGEGIIAVVVGKAMGIGLKLVVGGEIVTSGIIVSGCVIAVGGIAEGVAAGVTKAIAVCVANAEAGAADVPEVGAADVTGAGAAGATVAIGNVIGACNILKIDVRVGCSVGNSRFLCVASYLSCPILLIRA